MINSKRTKLCLTLLLCLFCLFVACNSCERKQVVKPIVHNIMGKTMGTTYSMRLIEFEPITQTQLSVLKRKIDIVLERINDSMSTYRKNSTISKFNRHREQGVFFVDAEMAYVVKNALRIGKLSKGAFDITVAPLVDLWGFDASGPKSMVPKKEDIKLLRVSMGVDKIAVIGSALKKFRNETEINLSGIAKGYGVDALCEFVKKQGYKNFMVEIGGEIRVNNENSEKMWKIGIRDPRDIVKKKILLL